MQAIRSWSGENKFFSGSDGGLDTGIWTGFSAWCQSLVSPQVQNWPCWCSPSIQSRSPLDVSYHCSLTQPNSCRHSPFLMETPSARLCQELPLSPPCPCGRCSIWSSDSMADLAANKVDWWRQNEDNLPHWAGAVKMVFSSSLLLQLLGELSPYSESPFQISSRLNSSSCGDQRDASLQSSPRQ